MPAIGMYGTFAGMARSYKKHMLPSRRWPLSALLGRAIPTQSVGMR